MIVVKHVDSIFGSLLPIRLSTFKLVKYCYLVKFVNLKVIKKKKKSSNTACLIFNINEYQGL